MEKRKPYPTDLTDEQWQLLAPMLPPPEDRGRPRTDLREVLNGIFYLTRAGCAWRLLPTNLPPWRTVYGYFRAWRINQLWDQLNATLRDVIRLTEKREVEPSAAIIDAQSVKIGAPSGVRGYDAGKKVTGRKRHILVDVMGLILAVAVTSAEVQDRDGAKVLLMKVKDCLPRLKLIWADGGYAGQLLQWVKQRCGWTLEIVKRTDNLSGFRVLPRRWVVERTFGWLMRYRRLVRDYESRTESSEAFIHIAMIQLMLKRLSPAA